MVVEHADIINTSFLHVPHDFSAGAILRALFSPEIRFYHWVTSFFHHADAAVSDAGGDGEWRMIDYYASACPHCVKLTPVWDDAKNVWATLQKNGEVPNVAFLKKECLDGSWNPGPAMDECKAANIRGFPTLKLINPSGKEIEFDPAQHPRTVSGILGFIKEQVSGKEAPPPEPQFPTPTEPTMVDYYAASCPHCKHLTPEWEKAAHDFKGIHWDQKECLDGKWQPGKDFEECEKAQIQGFPTIKFLTNGKVNDFEGPRTADAMIKFAKDHMVVAKHAGAADTGAETEHKAGAVEAAATDTTKEAAFSRSLLDLSLIMPPAPAIASFL